MQSALDNLQIELGRLDLDILSCQTMIDETDRMLATAKRDIQWLIIVDANERRRKWLDSLEDQRAEIEEEIEDLEDEMASDRD